MTVETFDINKSKASVVTVSDAAVGHFAKQLEKSQASAIRLSLKQAGCTGYKYVIDDQQGLNFNLIMENPNVKDECGCGESFSIEDFEQES